MYVLICFHLLLRQMVYFVLQVQYVKIGQAENHLINVVS